MKERWRRKIYVRARNIERELKQPKKDRIENNLDC